jgi:hypothetical protein
LAYQNKLFVNNPIYVKENYEHALNLTLIFRWDFVALSLDDNRKPISRQKGYIVVGDLTKLLADVDTLLFLISCQKSHQARYTTLNKNT